MAARVWGGRKLRGGKDGSLGESSGGLYRYPSLQSLVNVPGTAPRFRLGDGIELCLLAAFKTAIDVELPNMGA